MSGWMDTTCALCGRTLTNDDSFSTHMRLGKSWCWAHSMDEVSAVLGEDVSMHTLLWHPGGDD